MVSRRECAVSNHEAVMLASSFETPRLFAPFATASLSGARGASG
jgi:hypothetical protein